MKFSAQKLAEVLRGRLIGEAGRTASGVSIDTRTMSGGEVFVPIIADRDGHQFISQAIQKGAPIYLTSRENPQSPESQPQERTQEGIGEERPRTGSTGIYVEDTFEALKAMARHTRQERISGTVVGITGTAGKTSAKDLTLAALGERGGKLSVSGSRKSENNHLGVLVTLCNAEKENQALIVELGASAKGEIKDLAGTAQPSIGVVTSVGSAHIEGFGSLEALADAKAELVESLQSSGTAILNADNPGALKLAERTRASVLTYGTSMGCDVRGENISLDKNLCGSFKVSTPWGKAKVSLGARGAVNISNALAAIAVAGCLGVKPKQAAKGLRGAELSPLRMEVVKRQDGLVLINDAYNANPTSVKAALLDLKSLPAKSHTAILGTMKEMGDLHNQSHQEIAEFAEEQNIRLIAYKESAYLGAMPAESDLEALQAISSLGSGDVVLIKASRSVGLENLAEMILNSPPIR